MRAALLSVLLASALLSACATAQPLQLQLPGPGGAPQFPALVSAQAEGFSTSDHLLVVGHSGLGCPLACGAQLYVEITGEYIVAVGNSHPQYGQVVQSDVDALRAAILATNFAELRAKDFAQGCKAGGEADPYTYHFNTPGGGQDLSTCDGPAQSTSPLMLAERKLEKDLSAYPQ